MGQDLPERSQGAPTFVAYAMADPGVPGAVGVDLQRIQIIKGWVDAEGGLHQKVFEAAGGENGATVNPDTCERKDAGNGVSVQSGQIRNSMPVAEPFTTPVF